MQNKKSKVLVIALIISLVAIISLGSLAWFTAKDDVTNTIKLADDFEITVFEHDFNDPNTAVTTEGVTYTGIMPGQTIKKDPTVKNTGTHPEWVRVNVTLSHYDEVWKSLVASGTDLTTIFDGYDATIWEQADGTPVVTAANMETGAPSTVTITFYLRNKLEPYSDTTNNQYKLFDSVTIPGKLTSKQAAAMNGQFTIKVEAEAIQAENLDSAITTPQAAFALLGN